MTCRELLDALDSGASLSGPELAEHLAGCAGCRAAVARWRSTQDALRSLGDEQPPPFLHSRVMATLRAEQSRRTRRAPWALRVAWAGPALVLAFVALLAGHGLWRSATERPGEVPPVPVAGFEAEPPSVRAAEEAPPVTVGSLAIAKEEKTVSGRALEPQARGTGKKGVPLPEPVTVPSQPLGDLKAAVSADEKETSATSETSVMAAQARERSEEEGAPGSKSRARDFAVRAAAAPPAELAGAASGAGPWTLADAANGIRREVPPPPAGSLPGRGPWRLELGVDGSLTVTGAEPSAPALAPSDELRRWVSSLSLAPGVYTLTPPR